MNKFLDLVLKDNSRCLYKKIGPIAHNVKVIIQMLIGLAVTIYLLWFFANFVWNVIDSSWIPEEDFASKLPLAVVGYGLALSAGIELAYMLYTDGPDEAIDPLILGLSATAMIVLSHISNGSFESAVTLLVLFLGIGVLFWVRTKFLLNRSPIADPSKDD